jgi:hypothetical protein
LIRGAFHGWTVITHREAGEKLGKRQVGGRRVAGVRPGMIMIFKMELI